MVAKTPRIKANRHLRLTLGLAIGVLVSLETLPSHAEHLRAGAASVDITPKMGVLLDGAISKRGPAKEVHDRLHARALVLDDGNSKVGIVICDACMIGRDVIDAAKRMAAKEAHFNEKNLLVAATHTHSAVRAIHIGRGPLDIEYHTWLSRRIADALAMANLNRTAAKLGFGSFNKSEYLACRRFLCEPGSVGPNPFGEHGERIKSVMGKSEAVIEPAGPVDPQFSVVAVRRIDDSPLAVIGNYSVHYGGGVPRTMISADYFGAYSQSVEEQLSTSNRSDPIVAMLSNGTSGNTGAIKKDQAVTNPFERLSVSARTLAQRTVRSLASIDFRADVSIDTAQSELELGIRRPSAERLAWAKRVLSDPSSTQPHPWTRIYAQEAIHLSKLPATKRVMIQAIRLGDIGVVAIPCEVFAETGLAIKSQSPFQSTFTIELANGYGGYLPPPEQHRLGGYETWPARSSHLEVNAEPKIRHEALRLLRQLRNQQPDRGKSSATEIGTTGG